MTQRLTGSPLTCFYRCTFTDRYTETRREKRLSPIDRVTVSVSLSTVICVTVSPVRDHLTSQFSVFNLCVISDDIDLAHVSRVSSLTRPCAVGARGMYGGMLGMFLGLVHGSGHKSQDTRIQIHAKRDPSLTLRV